jgi:hypothetical protein
MIATPLKASMSKKRNNRTRLRISFMFFLKELNTKIIMKKLNIVKNDVIRIRFRLWGVDDNVR